MNALMINKAELYDLTLIHLFSDLHLEASPQDHIDGPCNLTGYTEWVSETTPVISISWDWEVNYHLSKKMMSVSGLPFTNITLTHDGELPMTEDDSLNAIRDWIESFSWQETVSELIKQRYS